MSSLDLSIYLYIASYWTCGLRIVKNLPISLLDDIVHFVIRQQVRMPLLSSILD